MYFIVYDIEATCWEDSPAYRVQEIIEIGALRFDEYGQFIDSFSKFVKPILNPYLSHYCCNLTTITQEDVNQAAAFPKVIAAFQQWIDIEFEEYLLCSWGDFDRRMFVQDCELHRLDSEWADAHINLKRQYMELKRLNYQRGLKAVVQDEGFEFTGVPHRAIYDADNLGKIFKKYVDEWVF